MSCQFSQDHAYSHEENRYKICYLCLGKTKDMFKIEGDLKIKLKIVVSEISFESRLPNSLCSSCRRNLYFVASGSIRGKKIEVPNFSNFHGENIATRSNTHSICKCTLCELARTLKRNKKVKNKSRKSACKRCNKCFRELKKGTPHLCDMYNQVNILTQCISELPIKQQEKVLASVIKKNITLCAAKPEMKDIKLKLSQANGGQPLNVIVKPTKNTTVSSNSTISVDDMSKIQTKYSLSSHVTLGIASDLRAASKNRKFIEPHLKEALVEKNHKLDNFFDFKSIDFVYTNKKNKIDEIIPKTVVYCKNFTSLIEFIKTERNISNDHLKFGIDAGGGFLKLTLSVQDQSNIDEGNVKSLKRRKLEDRIGGKLFKDTGVKKIFILAIGPSIQENYKNVLTIWKLLNIDCVLGTIATDLKLANILTGIGNHSSMFPCTWCYADKNNLRKQGELRTIGNCLSNYEAWKAAGSNLSKAKDFKNCINPTIFSGSEDTEIIQIIPPPELHLVLGVVNTVVDAMEKECEKETTNWLRMCNVTREITHGGRGFKGNSCITLLRQYNLDRLRGIGNLKLPKYVDVLEKFNKVVHDCFSSNLEMSYKESIRSFENSYLSLGISVTPKIHAIFFHVAYFCSITKRGLGFYSEQAVESVHYDFSQTWTHYKVSNNHAEYNCSLLKAVCSYNSKHL